MYNLGMYQKDYKDKNPNKSHSKENLEIIVKTFSHISHTAIHSKVMDHIPEEVISPIAEVIKILSEISDDMVCYAKTVYDKNEEVGSYLYMSSKEEDISTVLFIVDSENNSMYNPLLYLDHAQLISESVLLRFLIDRNLYKKGDIEIYHIESSCNTFKAVRRKVGLLLFFAYLHTGLLFNANSIYLVKLLEQLLIISVIIQFPSAGVNNTATSRISSFKTPKGYYHIYTNISKKYVSVVRTYDDSIDYSSIRKLAQKEGVYQIPLKDSCYLFPTHLIELAEAIGNQGETNDTPNSNY